VGESAISDHTSAAVNAAVKRATNAVVVDEPIV
jgi:hypothetical protein